MLILAICLCFGLSVTAEGLQDVTGAETVPMNLNNSDITTDFSLTPVVVQHDIIPEDEVKLNRSWTELPRSFEDAYMKAKDFFSKVPNDAFTRVFAAIYANVIIIIVIYAVLIIRNVHKSLQYVRHDRRTSFMRAPTFLEDGFDAKLPWNDVESSRGSRSAQFNRSREMSSLVRTGIEEAAYENIDTTLESVFSAETDGYEVPKTSRPRSILHKPGSFRLKTPESQRHVSFREAISQEFPITPPSPQKGSPNTSK